MRILLDSRDLIGLLERGAPVRVADLDHYLRTNNHQIVLCFSNVRELVSPIADGRSYLEIRPYLQTLEGLSHTYMKEVGIVGIELQAAVVAFTAGAEFAKPSPYVSRWDRTLSSPPGNVRPITEYMVNLTLDNLVYLIYLGNRTVFAPPRRHLPQFIRNLENDRAGLRAGRVPSKQHFINAVRKHAATHHVTLPQGREDDFARWVYRNPNRCPGTRLNHEIYRLLMGNYGDNPEASDFTDLALTFALPYVEAATLDRRIRTYCSQASRKLCKLGATQNYSERVYENAADLLHRF